MLTMFIAALFTTAKIWKQRKCPPTDKWKKDIVHTHTHTHTHTEEYYSAIKEENPTMCDNMDEPGGR